MGLWSQSKTAIGIEQRTGRGLEAFGFLRRRSFSGSGFLSTLGQDRTRSFADTWNNRLGHGYCLATDENNVFNTWYDTEEVYSIAYGIKQTACGKHVAMRGAVLHSQPMTLIHSMAPATSDTCFQPTLKFVLMVVNFQVIIWQSGRTFALTWRYSDSLRTLEICSHIFRFHSVNFSFIALYHLVYIKMD